MKLVSSSEPGAVERDAAIGLLVDRAILTRMVCVELRDGDVAFAHRRSRQALGQLLFWIGNHQREWMRGEPGADESIDQMRVPSGYEPLLEEIKAGAKVCNALFRLFTADNGLQAESDRAGITKYLASYWQHHPAPVRVGLLG
jgi:hypothetical protein